jgi:hypothetical protein
MHSAALTRVGGALGSSPRIKPLPDSVFGMPASVVA